MIEKTLIHVLHHPGKFMIIRRIKLLPPEMLISIEYMNRRGEWITKPDEFLVYGPEGNIIPQDCFLSPDVIMHVTEGEPNGA
jgi:hypothetical protein